MKQWRICKKKDPLKSDLENRIAKITSRRRETTTFVRSAFISVSVWTLSFCSCLHLPPCSPLCASTPHHPMTECSSSVCSSCVSQSSSSSPWSYLRGGCLAAVQGLVVLALAFCHAISCLLFDDHVQKVWTSVSQTHTHTTTHTLSGWLSIRRRVCGRYGH